MPRLTQLHDSLLAAINAAVIKEGVKLAMPVQSRVKEWESTAAKLRSGVRGVRDVTDLQDLVGLRLVVPFVRDVRRAQRAVRSACSVLREYDTAERRADDQFGYSAAHLVVTQRFMGQAPVAAMVSAAEIQIRTFAQHMWAEASYGLQYKTDETTPAALRRDVFRVAALLETVDREFEHLLTARDEYRRTVQLANNDTPLDVEVLEIALPTLWPAEHRGPEEAFASLVQELTRKGIRTLGDLRRLVVTHRSATMADAADEARHIVYATEHGSRLGNDYRITRGDHTETLIGLTEEIVDRARRGIFYSLSGLTFTALQLQSGTFVPRRALRP